MKILFLQRKANKAGAQVCLLHTIKTLQELNLHSKVLVGERGWLTDSLKKIDALAGIVPFPSFRSPVSKLIKLYMFKRTTDKIWETHGPFQIINANDMWDALITEWLALRWKIPWAVHLRSITTPVQPYDYYLKYHCHKANAVIAVSPIVYSLAKSWQHNILEYIPEGLSEKAICMPLSSEVPFPETVAVIGHGGEIKGWNIFADALVKIQKLGGILPAEIVFLGKAELSSISCIKQKIPKGIDISFKGHVDNLVEHITKVHLVIAPSIKESFGMAMIETIAAGVPLLASRTGIVPYIMGEDSQWTFEPGNPDELAEAWMRLPFLWHDRLNLLNQWQQRLRKEFLINEASKKLVELYKSCLP